MVRDEQPGGPYLEAIRRAFQFARDHGRDCDPADFLVGLAAGSAPGPGPRRRGVTAGWATWFGNRQVGLRDRWFRLRTSWHYRRCPAP